MSDNDRRGLTLEEIEPPYDEPDKQPKVMNRSRHVDNVLYVAGRSPVEDQEQYDIMFITVSVEEEEASTSSTSTFEFNVRQPAEYLKGATGIVKEVAMRAGLDMDRCYYTAVCKWVLPRAMRARPSKKIMRWGLPMLDNEIEKVKPKIIVCLGKPVLDLIGDLNIKFSDAHGCWFWSEKYQVNLYVMHAPYTLIGKPEYYETFRVDFKEVQHRRKMLEAGDDIRGDDVKFQIIRNQPDLEDWLDRIEELADGDDWPGLRSDDGSPLLAVDCEWQGRTHIDGQLRTIQFAWSETESVVIEFRDEQNWFTFELEDEDLGPLREMCREEGRQRALLPIEMIEQDGVFVTEADRQKMAEEAQQKINNNIEKQKYARLGKLIAATMTRIGAKYIGHHYAADAPWMNHVLGIEIYEKCAMDTEFAQQTCDESSELGLERGIAMKYTSLGRYDQELVMWKRENKKLVENGYGYIPSDILHPYGARDVIVPYRAYPLIKRQLEAQKLWNYYKNVFNPFVTDVFTEFTMTGLPMDIPLMDELRDLLTFTKGKLNKKLQERIALEAKQKLMAKIVTTFGAPALGVLAPLIKAFDEEGMIKDVKQRLAAKDKLADIPTWNGLIRHYIEAPDFNIRSPDQMRRWLFEVEGLEPIKSTNQKAKGLPSMAWEKVLELPKDRQAIYTPAVDKQTLQILAETYPTLDELLDLNAVGNLSKAFLKEPDIYMDPVTGEEVREENGLHAWIASDGRCHGQMSATETGRPRSWAPNTLNWPSYVNKRISRAISTCLQLAHEEGDIPEGLMKWLDVDPDDLPSIRSCVKAPEGWVMVESDYATAEMVALATISGDEDLMRILTEPDPEWAKLVPDNPFKAKSVRVAYAPPDVTGIPEESRNPEFLMHIWADGECLGAVTDDMLLRDADGNVVHAKYDIHWSLIERTYEKCREMMKDKRDRAAAKVLNFCCDGDSEVLTKERGAVAMRDIRLDDLLWDGVEWVHHEGVVYTGKKEIVEYQGLRATRLHDVWTVEKGKVKLEEACAQSLTLVRSADTCAGVENTRNYCLPRVSGEARVGLLLPEDKLRPLSGGEVERTPKYGARPVVEVSVSEPSTQPGEISWSRSAGDTVSYAPLQGHAPKMLYGHSRVVASLHGAGDQSGVCRQGGFHSVGSEELYGRSNPGWRLRQGGQRWELFQREFESDRPVDKSYESGIHDSFELSCGAGVPDRTPGGEVHLEDGTGPHEDGSHGRRDLDEACAEFSRGETETYDILNAGPRHRFTCSGVLVSNSSAYGATETSLERKIEADTGVKPEEGTGAKGLEAIAERQPRATQFLEEMAKVPKEVGYYRAASGRIRHCLLHGAGSGVGWRVRNSLESALGREMRNFPYCIGELKLGELMGSPIFSAHKVLVDFAGVLGNHEPSRWSNSAEGATTSERYLYEVCNLATSAQPSLN